MKELLVFWLPWFLSANTIYFTFLAGNKNKLAWLLALIGQFFWLIWIISSESWGLIPMNTGMWIVYFRNYLKWNL